MGFFDSIFINIKCPYCGQTSEMECQTKQIGKNLNIYYKGDFIDEKLTDLDCISGCHSKECTDYERKTFGYNSGFGRMIHLNLKLDEGVITGEYEFNKRTKAESLHFCPTFVCALLAVVLFVKL